ncbi:hypothetical protein A7U60_g2278 [Sanghuangporus baumii]|uniref:Uncharacterized protein n=1 Tax=Sanghuangporus baumii TaxID=108892 RepID=A0A9Q5I2R4_SANBA|nr:hypothetical protein A7U60_g2278 [Sanghuangporus baumii]
MTFISLLSSTFHVFDTLVLSLTSHTRLTLASEPGDYDLILRRTIREVKFYSETLLAILFTEDAAAGTEEADADAGGALVTEIGTEGETDGADPCTDDASVTEIDVDVELVGTLFVPVIEVGLTVELERAELRDVDPVTDRVL